MKNNISFGFKCIGDVMISVTAPITVNSWF